MQVYDSQGKPLRGDLVTRTALRTDLTPIPSTVELLAKSTAETMAALQQGKVIRVGPDQVEYLLVKCGPDTSAGVQQGGRDVATVRAVGILNSCAALGNLLQRSVIREGAAFAEIYRAIGATVQVDSDFSVPAFSCFVGMLPTESVARVLQEEAATVFLVGNKLRFRRLAELMASPAEVTFEADRAKTVESAFLERHAVPFALTTDMSGAIVSTRREAGRVVTYRPRADTRILNNMGAALITRKVMREGLSTTLNAGARVDVAGKPFIVVTALHLRELASDEGEGDEYTKLWLGEAVT